MENQANIFAKKAHPFFNSTVTYLCILLAFVALRIFAQFNPLSFLGDFQDLAYSLLIQVGIIFGLTLVIYKTLSGHTVKQIFVKFRFKKISVKAVFLCIGIGCCLIVLNTAFNSIYSLILSIFGYAPATSTITSYSLPAFLIAIFASAVLPAFCEEFANRGMLLNGLKRLGAKKAILISALLFALMHLNIGQFGYAFLIGVFLGFLCLATGSIWPGIIIHFLNNGIVEYLTFARVNDLPLGNYYETVASLSQGDFLSSIFLIFIILFAVLFLFAWLTYLLIKETRTKHLKNITGEIVENISGSGVPPDGPIKISVPLTLLGYNVFAKQSCFPTKKAKIPLYCTIFLGTVITIMTLIWNTL